MGCDSTLCWWIVFNLVHFRRHQGVYVRWYERTGLKIKTIWAFSQLLTGISSFSYHHIIIDPFDIVLTRLNIYFLDQDWYPTSNFKTLMQFYLLSIRSTFRVWVKQFVASTNIVFQFSLYGGWIFFLHKFEFFLLLYKFYHNFIGRNNRNIWSSVLGCLIWIKLSATILIRSATWFYTNLV